MVPAKGKRARKNGVTAAACPPSKDGRWLSLRTSKRLKRSRTSTGHNGDDDGLPFSDELLLTVFACSLLSLVDLVRCSATCRRWLRLVSTEAEFICRRSSPSRSATGPAVGFFHQMPEGVPRFLPLTASTSLDAAGEMFRSSRVVSSRNGRMVVELRRASLRAPLKLAVVNPMTGDSCILPTLTKTDRPPGSYACVVLTAADDLTAVDPPLCSSAFLVLLFHNRHNFTMCRTYTSDTGAWSPERHVSGTRISGARIAQMQTNAVTVTIGGVLFWRSNDAVVSLRVSTLECTLTFLHNYTSRLHENREASKNCIITASPDGRRLWVVGTLVNSAKLQVRVLVPHDEKRRWKEDRKTVYQLRDDAQVSCQLMTVHLLQACGKSGIVLFAASFGSSEWMIRLYTLDIGKKMAQPRLIPDVVLPDGVRWCCPKSRGSIHGYEMDRVDFLASLGSNGVGVGRISDTVEEKQTSGEAVVVRTEI